MKGLVVGIIGPTATGKTAVGISLARKLNGEIISADSMAIYRGMDIGTAKPTKEEQEQARFHLIDIVDPDAVYSAALFREDASRTINDILSRGKLPIVVGGTGLYIKALTGGFNIPNVPPDYQLREKLRYEASAYGNEYLLHKLEDIDPISASRLHPNDIKRIIRAIEVYVTTGKPISYYHSTEGVISPEYEIRLFGLIMDRQILYKRIEDRIDEQIHAGLVDEVRSLLDKGYSRDLPSMKGLGYKQIAAHLLDEFDLNTAIELFKRDTRRFAKRQFTWFKRVPAVEWIDMSNLNAENAVSLISHKISAVHSNP